MPTKAGVSARAIAKDYSGPDFSLTDEQINAADFLAKSDLPAYFISPDGDRIAVDNDKWKATFNGDAKEVSEQTIRPRTKIPADGNEVRAVQIAHLVDEGLSLNDAIEKTKPGSSQEGAKSSGVKIDPVVVQRRSDSPSPESEKTGHQAEPSQRLKAEMARIEEVAKNSPITWREAPFSRAKMFGANIWSRITGHGLPSDPAGSLTTPSEIGYGSQSRDIGVLSEPSIGRTIKTPSASYQGSPPLNSTSQTLASLSMSQDSQRQPTQPLSTPANLDASPKVSFPIAANSVADGDSNFRKIRSTIEGKVTGAAKSSLSKGGIEVKNGVANELSALKTSALGGIVGGGSGLGGTAGKVKGLVDTGQLALRAWGGDVSAMLKLGAKGLKAAWNNKEKVIGAAIGVGAMPFLALYAAVAPLLGFLGGVSAGISSALASLAGIGGALGGLSGLSVAALASPALGIGILTAGSVGFIMLPGGPKEQTERALIFGSDIEESQVIVEKTASPSLVKNDTAAEVEYSVKITNTADHDWDITIKDENLKMYKNGVATVLTMPDPITSLPTKLLKINDFKNPLVITFKKFAIKAGQYNDSQIKNIIEITATDQTSRKTETITAEATVIIGDKLDHPFGFPVGGILSSVDEDPCGDHWGAFFGVGATNVHGIDIVGGANAPVISTLTGKIRDAGFRNSGSNERNDVGGYVYIESDDGNFIAGFQHMNAPDPLKIKVGATVNRGEVIGTIYPTALPTTSGPHLHYQIIQRVGGAWQNVRFSDPKRAGSCTADPVDSPEANVIPYSLNKPTFDPASCNSSKRIYTPTGPVAQDVTCK